MADDKQDRRSLRDLNRHADRKGHDFGQADALDVTRPEDRQREWTRNPQGQAEPARLASDHTRLDAVSGGSIGTVEATEAETPPENLRRISDPSLPSGPTATQGAIERAPSTAGQNGEG